MIESQDQHRFEGDSGVDFASYAIDARFPNGEKIRVLLRLGAPFFKKDQWWVRTELENLDSTEWWIRTELENLKSTDSPIASAGNLHALMLGIRWLVLRLESFENKHGCQYFMTDSEEPFDYRSVLATHE